jgi:hypothetical protein
VLRRAENCATFVIGKTEKKRPVGSSRSKYEDNIKM